MAQPGELLLARPVYDAVRGTLEGRRVRFKGDVALRGRSGTIEVYSVTL
jgi:class 3 adenylate cyclase